LRNIATFNARLETLHQTASWKRLVDSKRCVVVVDGFYEWKGAAKVPHFVKRKDGLPIYMAGLYDVYEQQNAIDFAEDDGEDEYVVEKYFFVVFSLINIPLFFV
jgi:putative SOS response-associated peptidase YedK